jgi:hypothetical protein
MSLASSPGISGLSFSVCICAPR